VRRRSLDRTLLGLVDEAATRYLGISRASSEFARGKLRLDPVYLAVLERDILPDNGTIVDCGCGQGLMLALIASARRRDGRTGRSAHGEQGAPGKLYGIEKRRRSVDIARRALGREATILHGDLRVTSLPRSDALLAFDVMHLIPWADQDDLLVQMKDAIAPGGWLVLRDADASGGWRFRAVQVWNWLVHTLHGRWLPRFFFRTAAEWRERLERLGFEVHTEPAGTGTPFANVVFYARHRPAIGQDEESR
jgi:SAM-dependent methyltransferase